MTPEEIYRHIFAGSTARVQVAESAFASLRTALHRRHRQYTGLDLTTDRLTAKWFGGFATFKLTKRPPPVEYQVEVLPDA